MTDTEKKYIFIPREAQLLMPPEQSGLRNYVSRNLHTGFIEGTIFILTHTHIGSGAHMNVNDQLVFGNIVDTNNYPIIPASTIKGYLRNMVATIAGDSTFENAGFSNSIFGEMSKRSKVSIAEALNSLSKSIVTTVPRRFSPRDFNYDERRFYPHTPRVMSDSSGAVPIAVLPPQTSLSWRMTYQNINDTQLGSILIALGYQKPNFAFKLGGAKAFGCGSVQARELRVFDRNYTFDYTELSPQQIQTMMQSVVDQITKQSTVLNQIDQIHNWPY